ncbi:hypothetical protein SDC9_97044 [bioreactor metagenome]|uniref:Uncharacterized protein n=1 Tax=bioreactor metagenome TaxID=1076179 RepID=A0A645AAR8_9ZZZZ
MRVPVEETYEVDIRIECFVIGVLKRCKRSAEVVDMEEVDVVRQSVHSVIALRHLLHLHLKD